MRQLSLEAYERFGDRQTWRNQLKKGALRECRMKRRTSWWATPQRKVTIVKNLKDVTDIPVNEINPHKNKEASATLLLHLVESKADVALMQEP